MKESGSALVAADVAVAPGTEAGSQLFTEGRLPAGGGGVYGTRRVASLGDGACVEVELAIVGTGPICVCGAGEAVEIEGFGVAQPAAPIKLRIATTARAIG